MVAQHAWPAASSCAEQPGPPEAAPERPSTPPAQTPAPAPAVAAPAAGWPGPAAKPAAAAAEPRAAAAAPPGAAPAGITKVVVVSAGYDSGDIADFFIDDQLIPITGPEARRGLNTVIVDPGTARITSARTYDLWGDPVAQNRQLVRDLEALPEGHVVLAALKDSGMEKLTMDAEDALEEVGASIDGRLGFRESYALIGIKGGKALAERRSTKMILIDATLPFRVLPPMGSSPAAPGPVPAPPRAPVAPAVPDSGATGAPFDTSGRTWEEVLLMLDQLESSQPK